MMRSIARISFPGGGLFLPAKTPYERQVLFEYADDYARRHGQVHVELNRRQCTVSLRKDEPHTCVVCNHSLDNLTYMLGNRMLCRYCAAHDLM